MVRRFEKNSFWFRTISLLGSFILALICVILRVSNEDIVLIFSVYLLLIVAFWFLVNWRHVKKINMRILALSPLLYEEPEKYLAEIEKLVGGAKSSTFKVVYYVNSSAAYFEMRDYKKAKETLLKFDGNSILGLNRAIYYADLALYNIHLNEDEEALAIWEENKNEFMKLRNIDNVGPAVSSVCIFSLIKEGKKEEAIAALNEAKIKWTEPKDIREFKYLENMIK